jgi:hypothetical protein
VELGVGLRLVVSWDGVKVRWGVRVGLGVRLGVGFPGGG